MESFFEFKTLLIGCCAGCLYELGLSRMQEIIEFSHRLLRFSRIEFNSADWYFAAETKDAQNCQLVSTSTLLQNTSQSLRN
jgi:hypothetical protein